MVGTIWGFSFINFPLSELNVIKAIKQTIPNEANSHTAPLYEPSNASMINPSDKGATKPATSKHKFTTPTADRTSVV